MTILYITYSFENNFVEDQYIVYTGVLEST